jgi:hypothetical protein
MARTQEYITRSGSKFLLKELNAGEDCDILDYASAIDQKTGVTIILLGRQQIGWLMFGAKRIVDGKMVTLNESDVHFMTKSEANELLAALMTLNTPNALEKAP